MILLSTSYVQVYFVVYILLYVMRRYNLIKKIRTLVGSIEAGKFKCADWNKQFLPPLRTLVVTPKPKKSRGDKKRKLSSVLDSQDLLGSLLHSQSSDSESLSLSPASESGSSLSSPSPSPQTQSQMPEFLTQPDYDRDYQSVMLAIEDVQCIVHGDFRAESELPSGHTREDVIQAIRNLQQLINGLLLS